MRQSGVRDSGFGIRGKTKESVYQRIYKSVRDIPAGRVATYGGIAHRVGGCTPRQVGYAMAALPMGSDVPWHRVINSKGEISTRRWGSGANEQRELLQEEGVVFDKYGRINLREFGFHPNPEPRTPNPDTAGY